MDVKTASHLDLEPFSADLSVFTNGTTIIAIYVDDILLAPKSQIQYPFQND